MRHTTRRFHCSAFVCLLVLAATMSGSRAQQLSSPSYRSTGSFEAGAGQSSGPNHRLGSSIGPAEPSGVSLSPTHQLRSGREVPEVVQEILRFTLDAGWNLKGSPVTSDQAIGDIFKGSLGHTIKTGDLSQWDTANGQYLQSTDTDALDANYGFWVFSFWGGEGTAFTGTEGSTAPLRDQLQSGWNLYSPTDYTTLTDDSTIIVVWRWDAAAERYQLVLPGQNLVPLEGYWIYRE